MPGSSQCAWKASPTNFPPYCRAKSMRRSPQRRRRETVMGMSALQTGGRGSRGHRRRGRHHRLMSEINVTPFVDVMLVLLIIFMVAAPLLTVGVPIELPETQAKAMNSETQPITVSVNQGGQIYLQET